MPSVPGGRRRVSYPWSYIPLLSDGVDLPCGREIARRGATRHNSSLSNLQPPCQGHAFGVLRPASLRSQSPCARLGIVACRIEWFAGTVGVPEESEGACQKHANHVASVCQCATHVCPRQRIPTASDADPPLVEGSINRPLYLANARTCQLPRRSARRAGIRLVQWVRWPVVYLPTSALLFSPAQSL
jgi:hypothetical protein